MGVVIIVVISAMTTNIVKRAGREYVSVVSNVQHDQLDQAPCVEQRTQGPGILPGLSSPAGREHRASHLSSNCDGKNNSGPERHVGTMEKIQACPHCCAPARW
jgi:hypothetical protein